MGWRDWLPWGGTDTGAPSDVKPPSTPGDRPLDLRSWICPNCGRTVPAGQGVCGCGKRRPGEWEKPKDTYFTVPNWALATAATLAFVAVVVATDGLALIPEAIGAAGGAKTATAVVAIGVMGVSSAEAKTPSTPAPTPDVQGQVGSDEPAIDSSNSGGGEAVATPDPGIVVVDPGSGTDGSGVTGGSTGTTTTTNNGTTTTCDQNGCTTSGSGGGSNTGGGMGGCDHPDGCGGSSTGGDTGGGSGSGSGSG